jgi:hypothetical protein
MSASIPTIGAWQSQVTVGAWQASEAPLSVSDTVPVNESVVVQLSYYSISVVDSISITTSTSLEGLEEPILSITVVDNITSTEFTDLNLNCGIIVSDSIVITDSVSIINVTYFGTDLRPEHYPKLPTVSCEAAFRETISIGGIAPTVYGTGYFGSAVESKVPTPSAEITLKGLFDGYIAVASKLPTVEGLGIFGSIMVGKAPTVSCNAVLSNKDIIVSGYAPTVSAEIEIPNNFITILSHAPFPSLKATLTIDGYITVAGTVPTTYGAVVISEAITIVVIGTAPVVKAEYNSIQVGSSSMLISGTAPVVAIYQPTGEEDPGGISLSEEDRFADITLQYDRWTDAV